MNARMKSAFINRIFKKIGEIFPQMCHEKSYDVFLIVMADYREYKMLFVVEKLQYF